MLELRKILTVHFHKVQTYIQSGNIIVTSKLNSKVEIAEITKNEIFQNYGWEVPTLVLKPSELQSILLQNPYKSVSKEDARLPYVCIPQKKLHESDRSKLEELNYTDEYFTATTNAIYLYSNKAANKTKLSNNLLEKKLNTRCTTRNWRTLNKLYEMTRNENGI